MSKKPGECDDGENCPATEYVTIIECVRNHAKLDLAIFGIDGRGGIVKDIQEIKTATNVFRAILLPVILSVGSAALTAFLLTR